MDSISTRSKKFALLAVAAIALGACGGSSENSSSASSAVTRTKNNALPTEAKTTAVASCATGGACAVGDTGPGGGKVFYVATSKFTSTGSDCGTKCRYLEAAPIGWIAAATPAGQPSCYSAGSTTQDPMCQWSGNEGDAIGTTGTGIGTGYANTSAMIAQSSAVGKAGTAARAFQGGGKTDWHLPSLDELEQLYNLKDTVGGVTGYFYWSSSEFDADEAWADAAWIQNPANQAHTGKFQGGSVRPVRAFSSNKKAAVQAIEAVTTTTTSTTIAPTTTVKTTTTIAPTTTAVASCATGGACAVGDTGPGGGKVFYVASSSFASLGSACFTTCKYLEAAPTGWIKAATPAGQTSCISTSYGSGDPACEWSDSGTENIATEQGIGTGYSNTSKMIAQNGTKGKAATAARGFQGGGKTDWHLPSKDELIQMYIKRTTIGGFTTTEYSSFYWSSSAHDDDEAWAKLFSTGANDTSRKYEDHYVRPVRAFAQLPAAVSCATGSTCVVGDTGPGGGKVFYVASSRFTAAGSACDDRCRYLEAAPTGWIKAATPAGQTSCISTSYGSGDPACEWSDSGTENIATEQGIGTGYSNTSKMIAQNGTKGKAATAARGFQGGGKTDWHLPSKDELIQMYIKRTTIGGFTTTEYSSFYWSSSAHDDDEAWAKLFSTGANDTSRKYEDHYVRPVRAF